jgi:ribosome-associated protein YbcJ (S4-like RNA binding protein)
VNGERESRRGRQLAPGDAVTVGADELLVTHGGTRGPAAGPPR